MTRPTRLALDAVPIDPAALPTFELETPSVDSAGAIVRWDTRSARRLRVPIGEGVELEMVLVPAGALEMGSAPSEVGRWKAEGPRHRVDVAAFLLGRYPVTQEQWRVVASLPAIGRELDPSPSRFEGPRLPVDNINWHDAVELCARLESLTGRSFRLPTEAEWEHACRAGTDGPFSCGETITHALANYCSEHTYAGEPAHEPVGRTTEVGSYAPNAFGLHDMHGNVFEWCADGWHFDLEQAPHDARPWLEHGYQNYRPLRGGAWCTYPRGCRSAYRSAAHQSRDHRMNTYGVRLALGL